MAQPPLAASPTAWRSTSGATARARRPRRATSRWRGIADDVLAVVDALGLGGVPGGRPLDGRRGPAHGRAAPTRDASPALWLFEPIVFPPARGRSGPASNPLAAAARRRRPRFADREAAYANFASKPPLDGPRPRRAAGLRRPRLARRAPTATASSSPAPPRPRPPCSTTGMTPRHLRPPRRGGVPGHRRRRRRRWLGPAQMAPAVADALPHGTLERHPTLTPLRPDGGPGGAWPSRSAPPSHLG